MSDSKFKVYHKCLALLLVVRALEYKFMKIDMEV